MAYVRKHRHKWQVLARVHGKERSFGSYALKGDAERRKRDIESELDRRNGNLPDYASRKTPLSVWIRDQRALKERSQATADRDETSLRAHIDPEIGQLPLGGIDTGVMRRFLVYLTGNMAPATTRKVWQLVDSSLRRAVTLNVLDQNPCAPLRDDLPSVPETIVEPLPVEIVDALIAATDDRYSAMIELAAFAGLRWGEIAALRWTHVDLHEGSVTVAGSMQRNGEVKPPKTSAGRRKVRLARRSVDALARLPRSEMFVFPAPAGGALKYHNWRKRVWAPAIGSLGLTGFRFHDLRHTHASWLIDQGVDIVKVSKRLGHSRPSTTVNIYAHLIDVDESEIIDTLEAMDGNVRRLAR
jgi:integrase